MNRTVVLSVLVSAAIIPSVVHAYTEQQAGLLVFCKAETAVKVGYAYKRTVHFTPVFKMKSSTYDRDMNWNSVKDYEESFGRVSLTGSYSSNGIEGQFTADESLDAYLPQAGRKECALSTSIENVREYRRSQKNPVETELLKGWRPNPNYQTAFLEVLDFPDSMP